MARAITQTIRIIVRASLLDLLFLEYVRGCVTARYLSTLIAQRLRILAVHSRTSREIQMSHRIQPNSQVPKVKEITIKIWDFK